MRPLSCLKTLLRQTRRQKMIARSLTTYRKPDLNRGLPLAAAVDAGMPHGKLSFCEISLTVIYLHQLEATMVTAAD